MRRRRLGRVLEDWRQGRRYGYPLCCVAHYCWDSLVGWPSGVIRWHQIDYMQWERCVPCGIFHAGDSPHPSRTRAWLIIEFNWRHLQPTRAGRSSRAIVLGGPTYWRDAENELKTWASDYGALERLYWDDGGLDPELEWK